VHPSVSIKVALVFCYDGEVLGFRVPFLIRSIRNVPTTQYRYVPVCDIIYYETSASFTSLLGLDCVCVLALSPPPTLGLQKAKTEPDKLQQDVDKLQQNVVGLVRRVQEEVSKPETKTKIDNIVRKVQEEVSKPETQAFLGGLFSSFVAGL